MASLVNNAVFLATLGGTGAFVVASAVQGYQTPAAVGAADGKTYRYRAQSLDLSQWEEGDAIASASASNFTRVVAASSSGGTTTVNFASPPNVILTIFAADILQFNDTMSLTEAQQSQGLANLGVMVSPTSRASLLSGTAITTSDIVNQTTVWMVLGDHDMTSVLASGIFVPRRILANKPVILDAATHLANAQHDIWEYVDASLVVQYGFGPAWTVGGGDANGPGTGAGSAERDFSLRGRATNKYPMVVRNNSVNSASIPAGQANLRGTVGIAAVAGTTADAKLSRLVSNWQNVARRRVTALEAGTTWAGDSASTPAVFRRMNNGVNATFSDVVMCGGSHFGSLTALLAGAHATTLGQGAKTGIGLGSTSVSSSSTFDNITLPLTTSGQSIAFKSYFNDSMPQGRYKVYPLEYSGGDATTTFYGFNGSGLDGWIEN